MEKSRERSRPRRSKKPICRLQVCSDKQVAKYTETQLGSQLPRVSVKLRKISFPHQESTHVDVENNEERPVVSAPSMVTYASDEEDWYGPSAPVGDTSLRQSVTVSEATSPCRIEDIAELRRESQDLAGGGVQSDVDNGVEDRPPNKRFRSVGEDISFAVKGVLGADIKQSEIKSSRYLSGQVEEEGINDGTEVNNSFDLTDLIENGENDKSPETRTQEKAMELSMDDVGASQTGSCGVGASRTGSCSEPSGWAGSDGAKNSPDVETLKTSAVSHEIEILANDNVNKSLENRVEEFRDNFNDNTKDVELNDNVAVLNESVDRQSTSTCVSQTLEGQTGGNELVGDGGEKNNNDPAVVEGGKKKECLYLINWVPVLRKKKLCVEGDLLRFSEEPSVASSRYFTSRILERDSERRVASKNSLYALEGPLLIPDPAVCPMPLFVIEKFRNGFPEDWKTVAQIWASFSDHEVLVNSASQPDMARFSVLSSEIGSKVANICAMTDGSLVSNMAAINEGSFLAVTSTPAKEYQPHPSGAFLSDLSSVHSQEMSQVEQGSENGKTGESGHGS